jgi:hypothetical protein
MKITIDIDCTPEEVRRFMGLPDVAAMQESLLKEMHQRMMANIGSLKPGEMTKAWLPMGLESWMDFQKSFWKQLTSAGQAEEDKPSSS